MSCTKIYVAYRGPDGPRKEKDAYKPSKGVTREDERTQFIIYHFHQKGDQSRIHRAICLDLWDTSL